MPHAGRPWSAPVVSVLRSMWARPSTPQMGGGVAVRGGGVLAHHVSLTLSANIVSTAAVIAGVVRALEGTARAPVRRTTTQKMMLRANLRPNFLNSRVQGSARENCLWRPSTAACRQQKRSTAFMVPQVVF